jgi:hypothetical protein
MKTTHYLLLFLLLLLLISVPVVSCGDDDDDDDDDDFDGDDDNVPDPDLEPCEDAYTVYPGWFNIPDFYDKANDFWKEFGPAVTADCVASLSGKDLTVDCGPWEFSAEWVAAEGNFPVQDQQVVKVYGNWINADTGTAKLFVFDESGELLFFQTTDGLSPFNLDEGHVDIEFDLIELCAFSIDDPAFELPEGAYWNYISALGVIGNIEESDFVVDVQNDPVLTQDNAYFVRVYDGYRGYFDWPEEKWFDRVVGQIGVQALINQ